MCVTGYVNGHSIKFALHSGCTTSIISRNFVKRNGLSLNESKINIKTANNNVSKVDGKTDSHKVEIEGHVCDLEFLVIKLWIVKNWKNFATPKFEKNFCFLNCVSSENW